MKANHTSEGFKIELGEYWSAQVFVGNFTDSGQVIKDLPIVEVYLPNKADQTQDILKFAFPLDITEEELLSNCGEPQEKDLRGLEDEYGLNEYEYSRESTKYFSDSKYIFEFSKGSIRYLTLSWLP